MAKILLVEDDNNLREIYEARLQAEGYTIVSAKDGEEALVLAKQEKPDLVISDVMMPRISGFEMLDILRNTEGLKDVKVIMLTALGQAEDKTRADNLGADRYLVKSQVTLEDIVKAAGELLAPTSGAAPAAPAATAPAPAPQPVAPSAVPVTPSPSTPAPIAPATTPTVPSVAPESPTPEAVAPTAPDTPAEQPPAGIPTPVSPPQPPASAPPTPAPVPSPVALSGAPAPTPQAPPAVPSIPEPATPTPTVAAPEPAIASMQPATAPVVPAPVAAPAPSPTPPEPPVPATPPAPAPVPEPAPPTPPASDIPPPTPEQPTTPPAPTAPVAESDAQSSSDEEAAIKAQIDSFITQNNQTAPKPEEASQASAMADAIKQLTSNTTTEAPTASKPKIIQPSTAPVTPAPAPAASADEDKNDGGVEVAHKKVIRPISAPETAKAPDLNELLAKEGFSALDDPAVAPPATPAAPAPTPHMPGHVISPSGSGGGTAGVDPNSIAL